MEFVKISRKEFNKLSEIEQAKYNALAVLQWMKEKANRNRKYVHKTGKLINTIVHRNYGAIEIKDFENLFLKHSKLTYEEKCDVMKIFTNSYSFFHPFNKELRPFETQFK